MRKHAVSAGVGTAMLATGLVLYVLFADVETPVVGLRQAGVVLAVLGLIELAVSGFALLRLRHR